MPAKVGIKSCRRSGGCAAFVYGCSYPTAIVSVHINLQDLIPTLALVVCAAHNYAAKVGIKSCRFV